MILKRLKLYTGFAEPTNCYIVQDEKSKETIVIDPGAEPEKIIDMLNILEAKLKYIYLTHCHADHIGAVSKLHETKGGKILIHRYEADNLHNNNVNLANYVCDKEILLEADYLVNADEMNHSKEQIKKMEDTVFKTSTGNALLESIYLR